MRAYNYEMKGIISIGDEIDITCCYKKNDIIIDGQSLHNLLDEEIGWFDVMQVRYIILDNPPKKDTSFESLAGDVITSMLYSKSIAVCYTEWTCGDDGWDYLAGEDGHSIFDELANYAGKYVYLIL